MYRVFLILLLFLSSSVAAKPNVLLITIDTLRADHLGSYGHRTVRTPNLDSLAKNSLFFENAVCPAPLTLVSHASLLTGRNPYHHGLRNNAGILDAAETTLPQILKRNGYHTYAVVGGFPLDHRFGLDRGFDVYDDRFPRDKNRPLDFRSERPADAVIQAVPFQSLTEPYFLWVHFYDPHAPYHHGGYAGEIEFVDQQVGILMNHLKTDNLITAVAGDHGESLGEHGEYTHRIFVYDSVMRVPFWMRGPDLKAQRIKEQVRLIDFVPTLLSILRIPAPGNLDGAILPQNAGRSAYLESMFPRLELGWAPLTAIRTGDWKYIHAPRPELYDLRNDPAEKTNLASIRPEAAASLRGELPKTDHVEHASISPEMREQLAALGYVSGASSAPVTNIDPKDRIDIWNQIEQIVDLQSKGAREATAMLETAWKKDPDNPMLLSLLADQYTDAGRYDAARNLLKRALDKDPKNALAMHRIALVSLSMKRAGEAKIWASALQKLEPSNPEAHALLARSYLILNEPAEAALQLEEALRLDPGDTSLRVDLANLYAELNRLPAARDQFRLILKQEPGNLQALNGLATCEFLDAKYDAAETHLNRAAGINATDPQTQMNLALLYSKTGRIADAVTLYRKALASPLTPEEWKTLAGKRLKELQQ